MTCSHASNFKGLPELPAVEATLIWMMKESGLIGF